MSIRAIGDEIIEDVKAYNFLWDFAGWDLGFSRLHCEL
jgi:hypothetical protein